MGFTTRVKSEASEKKPFNFALFWDKYGTFFILAIIVAIFGSLSPEYFLTTNNITQIFVQSSVTVLIGMGEFFAILVAGIDLSVGAILALSGMVTAKLMLPLGGLLISIFTGWYLDKKLVWSEITNNGTLKVPIYKLIIFILKYVAPIAISVIFINELGLLK